MIPQKGCILCLDVTVLHNVVNVRHISSSSSSSSSSSAREFSLIHLPLHTAKNSNSASIYSCSCQRDLLVQTIG